MRYTIKYLVWGNHETFSATHTAVSILELVSRVEWMASGIRVVSVEEESE